MQAHHFDVYDIDGTLTVPGHDLWYLCTRTLSADNDLFDRYVAEWKTEIQSGMDPFERSLTMMKRGLKLLKEVVSSELVTREVQQIASDLIDEGLVWREAINFLKGRLRNGIGRSSRPRIIMKELLGFSMLCWSKVGFGKRSWKRFSYPVRELIGAPGALFISIWVATKLLAWWMP
jgi:hypothetical protein